jgi:hypothetical protein
LQSLLGAALFGLKNFPEAEKYLLAAHTGLKTREAQSPSPARAQLLKSIAERLVQLYEAWDKKDKVEQWRQNLR